MLGRLYSKKPPLVGVLTLVLVLLAAVPAVAGNYLPDKVCVLGFSKDFGALRLNSGIWNNTTCNLSTLPTTCRTLEGNDASAGGFFFSDGAQCVNGNLCDEVPALDGRFEAQVDVQVRLQDPCPVRGAWEGTFRLLDAATYTQLLAVGTIEGTLGVGTHREPTQPCESCRIARFDPLYSRWYFHSEGFINGEVVDGPYKGCEMKVSFQGEFNANGDPSGPQPPGYNWGFEGKADGVLLCPCP